MDSCLSLRSLRFPCPGNSRAPLQAVIPVMQAVGGLAFRPEQLASRPPIWVPEEIGREAESHLVVGQAKVPQLREGWGQRLVPGLQWLHRKNLEYGRKCTYLGCLRRKKKNQSQSALMIKKLKIAKGQNTLPMACGGKNDHCREAGPKGTCGVIKEDVSKGPEFWLQVLWGHVWANSPAPKVPVPSSLRPKDNIALV